MLKPISLDTDLQNHLCTFKPIKRSRFREFILNRVLRVTEFFCRKIYIFSTLGELSTIHFARWIVIDGERSSGGQRSNYDKPSASTRGPASTNDPTSGCCSRVTTTEVLRAT